MNATEIKLQNSLRQLDVYLEQILATSEAPLSRQMRELAAGGGKRLRPALVFCCARLCAPALSTSNLLPLAAAAEMVHAASLIHDDIIDDSGQRRGQPSLHTQISSNKAVLYGDYLLAGALELLAQYPNPKPLPLMIGVTKEMCLGELQQQMAAFCLESQSVARYFKQIRRKTGGLMMACCRMGALAAEADDASEQALISFGAYLGLAFQLNDDLGDFADNPSWGKPRGQDLRQGLFTLPLFFALKNSPQADLLAELAQKRDKSENELDFLLREVANSGGLAETRRVAAGLGHKAARALTIFPDSAEKHALQTLAENISVNSWGQSHGEKAPLS